MAQIHYEPDRKGFTVLPDLIDEATGVRIEDTGMIADTRHAAFAKQDQPDLADPETEYEVSGVDVRRWSTRIYLYGVSGSYNSACFHGIT